MLAFRSLLKSFSCFSYSIKVVALWQYNLQIYKN